MIASTGNGTGSTSSTGATKFWNQIREQSRKVQLQGEIQLLKRQIVARQKRWGVEFFDLITNEKQTLLGVSAGTLFAEDKSPQVLAWREPLESLREGLRSVKDKHGRLEGKCQSLFNTQNHDNDDGGGSGNDYCDYNGGNVGPGKALDKIKIAAQRKQLQAQLLVLEQQMKIKKEKFGISVFSGLEMSRDLSKLNTQEQRVQKCIDNALSDVHQLQAQINAKFSQIHSNHHGDHPDETEGLMMEG